MLSLIALMFMTARNQNLSTTALANILQLLLVPSQKTIPSGEQLSFSGRVLRVDAYPLNLAQFCAVEYSWISGEPDRPVFKTTPPQSTHMGQ
jgi:hypothetical protein